MRIAMWSGPRNLSTAMMYAYGNRPDFDVIDEPFYAAYLVKTGLNHPMRDEIIASQPTDPAQVVERLIGSNRGKKPHFYQKHMTQHMVPGMPRGWMAQVKNVFLLRHPARVIASFSAKYENLTLEDIGFAQQSDLYDDVLGLGAEPIVIDSSDIRQNPERQLRKLCSALDLDWNPAMLSWPRGGHAKDGAWAPHWYGAVHKSTGFAGPEGALPNLSGHLAELTEQAMPHYERLLSQKLD